MKRIALFICTMLLLTACIGKKSNNNPSTQCESIEELEKVFIDAVLDTNATCDQVVNAFKPYGEALKAAAKNVASFDLRKKSQSHALSAIELLSEVMAYMEEQGIENAEEQFAECFGMLLEATNTWLVNHEREGIRISHDVYYVAHQNSGKPEGGFFKIEVFMPKNPETEVSVHITYPRTAEIPYPIVFTKKMQGHEEFNDLKEVYPNNQETVSGGKPYEDTFGAEFYTHMLQYENMYFVFKSKPQIENGQPGEMEMAMVPLYYFQKVAFGD